MNIPFLLKRLPVNRIVCQWFFLTQEPVGNKSSTHFLSMLEIGVRHLNVYNFRSTCLQTLKDFLLDKYQHGQFDSFQEICWSTSLIPLNQLRKISQWIQQHSNDFGLIILLFVDLILLWAAQKGLTKHPAAAVGWIYIMLFFSEWWWSEQMGLGFPQQTSHFYGVPQF